MALNYFTCTLGEAVQHGLTKPHFENISSFFDHQAAHIPDTPAAGFFSPQKDNAPWTVKIYSFGDLRDISLAVAERLKEAMEVTGLKTVALLCPSTAELMVIWLALIRLDIAVLLLAPQCQSDAIAHLCRECEADVLLYHQAYEKAAGEAVVESKGCKGRALGAIDIAQISGLESALYLTDLSSIPSKGLISKAGLKATAYIHHTSGTSSGLPKPIPQAHTAAVGALPKIPHSPSKATFTTTPLYHGGIADAFRSWTSEAMIWLFPGKEIPITGSTVVKALDAAAKSAKETNTPSIAYFSSVPYVLQLLEEDNRGLEYLRNMDIVGVGGAALPNEVGDRLVKGGVNLVSRFGSSECGFLMSSHRTYDKDQSWQFLRDNVGSKFLRFEPRDDGLSELVVLPSWPHRAKTNREDGSFATADLFEPHPSIPNAWRYHSRADSQLTLITGKKFDPAPLEGALADSPLVADALIFGNNQPYPGVLLFRSQESKDVSDYEMLENVWPTLEQLNARSQDHARIARDMVKAMPWQSEPLEKSSKGTLIRKEVQSRFAKDIEAAYVEKEVDGAEEVPDDQVEERVFEIVKHTLGRSEKLDRDTDLFAYGVDSIAAMRIRGRLQGLLRKGKKTLPATVVESCGSVRKISQLIIDIRNGKTSISDSADELRLMQDLVDEYSHFVQPEDCPQTNGHSSADSESRETIVLTGATGVLGTHVLALCADNPRVHKVICLIRGEDENAARGRLEKALEGRKLSPLSKSNVEVEVLPAKLGDSKLGLSDEVFARLAREATVILHLAWEVNFRMNLRSFRNNSIASVTNLIKLALSSPRSVPPRLAFCSSAASVMAHYGSIPESPSDSPSDASSLGYSRSKWVAEAICQRAARQTRMAGHLSVLRVGQLAGDTATGVWNEKEAWPMMLSTVKLVKALPVINDEPLNWLPVDIAAQAFIEAAVEKSLDRDERMEVVHVLNQHREATWMDLLEWLKKDVDFEVLPPEDWLARLEEAQSKGVEHPAFRLIGLWRENLCKEDSSAENNVAAPSAPHFETIRSVRAAPVLADVKPVDEAYFRKIWRWIDESL